MSRTARNGKVYISHPMEDDALANSLVETLKARHVDVWYERMANDALGALDPAAQREIDGRDIFIRILTRHTAASRQMALELEAFERAQALDGRHARIDLLMDSAYAQPADSSARTINTTDKPESFWLPSILSEVGRLNTSLRNSNALYVAIAVAVVVIAFLAYPLGLILVNHPWIGPALPW